ncbi:receptor-like protein 12 isoform X2 [Rosa chinensis]|uniref:receptor-like protein 12 isoform X2 n=1 Tax=Rosa chinensis TaxID=74649 RepID=UPI001AD8D719|nr:receptor-like protein 12 isoform X2 [Rosa chinensis]
MIDIGHNNFHGQLPRSLANCARLESLVLSHNKFNDTFPVWLGALPELKILKMDHNVFHGVILKHDKKNLQFPVLRILDLSYNDFLGQFPFEYIFSGNGTTSITHDLEYYRIYSFNVGYYSITIICKGVERYYPRVREDLILIDISSNNFEGKIPEFIGKLQGIWSLNLSNNILTGRIPSSLSNLSRLESLDLSHNKLSALHIWETKDCAEIYCPRNVEILRALNFHLQHQKIMTRALELNWIGNLLWQGQGVACWWEWLLQTL